MGAQQRGGEPTGREAAVVALLVNGATAKQAAAETDISYGTVRRIRTKWLDHIRAEQDALWEATAAASARAVPRALATMVQLLESPHDAVRLGASRTLVEAAIRLREHHHLGERLAALETSLAHQEAKPWEATAA